jgi:hypothetical protein
VNAWKKEVMTVEITLYNKGKGKFIPVQAVEALRFARG